MKNHPKSSKIKSSYRNGQIPLPIQETTFSKRSLSTSNNGRLLHTPV
ncbi:MAG: hypothetical protein V7L22_09205 [Nostoc sp.]